MTTANGNREELPRPFPHRLLHALGEAVLGLALGGGSFVGIWELGCYQFARCEDFKGLAYMTSSFIAALVICAVFFSLCRRFRHRLKARYRLDAVVGVFTVVVWILYLV